MHCESTGEIRGDGDNFAGRYRCASRFLRHAVQHIDSRTHGAACSHRCGRASTNVLSAVICRPRTYRWPPPSTSSHLRRSAAATTLASFCHLAVARLPPNCASYKGHWRPCDGVKTTPGGPALRLLHSVHFTLSRTPFRLRHHNSRYTNVSTN